MKIYDAENFKPFNFSKSLRRILSFSNNDFNEALLGEEIFWLSQFLNTISKHLTFRSAQGANLANQDLIKYQLAGVTANIQILRCIRLNGNEISWSILSDLIREVCLSLAKLAGARALLCENVIEMLWTFELLNQIYWVGNDE